MVGPIFHTSIVNKEDVLKSVAGHITEVDAMVFKADVGEGVALDPLAYFKVRPAVVGNVVTRLEKPSSVGVRRYMLDFSIRRSKLRRG